jgi:hypothetical protein
MALADNGSAAPARLVVIPEGSRRALVTTALLLLLNVVHVEAGRRPVGSVGSLFSEGILTWEDSLGLDSAATLHVSGKLGTACGDIAGQALCALQSVESTFSLGFGIPVEEFPMAWATECRVYLVDMDDYGILNSVYTEFFANTPTTPPVRLCLAVDELPVQGLVEVQCTGHYDGPWAQHNGLKNSTAVAATVSSTATQSIAQELERLFVLHEKGALTAVAVAGDAVRPRRSFFWTAKASS